MNTRELPKLQGPPGPLRREARWVLREIRKHPTRFSTLMLAASLTWTFTEMSMHPKLFELQAPPTHAPVTTTQTIRPAPATEGPLHLGHPRRIHTTTPVATPTYAVPVPAATRTRTHAPAPVPSRSPRPTHTMTASPPTQPVTPPTKTADPPPSARSDTPCTSASGSPCTPTA